MNEPSLARRAVAESIGTAFLTLGIIGSGIAASRLSHGDAGFTLVANAVATGLVLVAIVLALGSVSGGHLNPAVTLVAWTSGGLPRRDAGVYGVAQLAGAVLGAIVANVMFGLNAIDVSDHARSGWELWTSEVVATFGLVLIIFGLVRSGRSAAVPFAVGAYIAAAILFTSSTAFANPAATVARSLTDTFAGIAPTSVPMFVIAQFIGAVIALVALNSLAPRRG
ncbi:MAG TPA: MIP/aquaporin family protein [Actinomycetota bacterium]|nr:MIP/aquaporin family protein [Actinomycetota bacterium]